MGKGLRSAGMRRNCLRMGCLESSAKEFSTNKAPQTPGGKRELSVSVWFPQKQTLKQREFKGKEPI